VYNQDPGSNPKQAVQQGKNLSATQFIIKKKKSLENNASLTILAGHF